MKNSNKTDKNLLVKGLQKMGISLIFMFLGPTIIYLALSNKEKPLFIPILVFGFAGCIAAIYFIWNGLSTILDSMFKEKQINQK